MLPELYVCAKFKMMISKIHKESKFWKNIWNDKLAFLIVHKTFSRTKKIVKSMPVVGKLLREIISLWREQSFEQMI